MAVQTVDWNAYATAYDTLMLLDPYVDMLEDVTNAIIAHTTPPVRQNGKILDAGCGTGNLISILRAYGIPARNIAGIDTSPVMCEHARRKHGSDGVSIRPGDLNYTQQFLNETFDSIACVNAFYTVADPRETLREFSRLLKVGGTLVIANPLPHINLGLILKAHAKSEKPNMYWERFKTEPDMQYHLLKEALANTSLAMYTDEMNVVLSANRSIVHSRVHFLGRHEMLSLFSETGFVINRITQTYANQNILTIAHRYA